MGLVDLLLSLELLFWFSFENQFVSLELFSDSFALAFANLNPCRIERCILILPRANENDVLEPLKTFEFAKFVEAGVLDVFGIAHAQLRERHRLTPLLQKPHASVE